MSEAERTIRTLRKALPKYAPDSVERLRIERAIVALSVHRGARV